MTLYMQYHDKQGHVSVVMHQVWDRERFIAAQMASLAKEGGIAIPTDEATYRHHNWSPRSGTSS